MPDDDAAPEPEQPADDIPEPCEPVEQQSTAPLVEPLAESTNVEDLFDDDGMIR